MARTARSRTTKKQQAVVEPTLRSPATELGPRASRTIAKILEATRAIFLSQGYAGTTIDEIAVEAGISRASFYTYFPTKRDVLLTLGAESARESDEMVERLASFPEDWTDERMTAFVHEYFQLLHDHGSFAMAWTQAAHADEELRAAGQARHLKMCNGIGTALGRLRGVTLDDPTAVGLAWFSMLERAWSYGRLYDAVSFERIETEIAGLLIRELRR